MRPSANLLSRFFRRPYECRIVQLWARRLTTSSAGCVGARRAAEYRPMFRTFAAALALLFALQPLAAGASDMMGRASSAIDSAVRLQRDAALLGRPQDATWLTPRWRA